MTIEEAIEEFRARRNKVFKEYMQCRTEYINGDELCKVAIEALKKQMPKKPKDSLYLESDDMYVGKCPNCGYGMNSEMNYCDYCGQALRWEE